MKQYSTHLRVYRLMGHTLKLFLLFFYLFLSACFLLTIFNHADQAWALLKQVLPWFAKGLLTLACGVAIISFVEAIR